MNHRSRERKARLGSRPLLVVAMLTMGFSHGSDAAEAWICQVTREFRVSNGEPVEITIPADSRSDPVVLEERGGELMYTVNDGVPHHLSYPMTRYAWRWIYPAPRDGRIKVQAVQSKVAILRVHERCEHPAEMRWKWLLDAQQLADSIDSHVQADPEPTQFDDLVKRAPTHGDRVAALHMRALVWFLKGDNLSAAQAYRELAPQWLTIGDRARAAAAWIGAADLYGRAARWGEAQEPLASAEKLLDPINDAYFLARIRHNRCLALQTKGQLQEAVTCSAMVMARYREIGEIDAALTVASSVLVALRDSGDPKHVDQLLDELSSDPEFAHAEPRARGNLTLIRGYIERDKGNLMHALELFGAAFQNFEEATEARARWQASALLQAADIYGQLGMTDQAYRLLTQSLSLYAPASAPARTAAALMKMAILDRSAGRTEAAGHWYARAEQIYALLDMPIERSDAELGLLETRLPPSAKAARAELHKVRDWSMLSAANSGRLALVVARWLIIAGEFNAAEAKLKESEVQTQAFSQRLLRARLRAELAFRQGRSNDALTGLEQQLAEFSRWSGRSARGALAYLAARSARELIADWVRLALSQDPKPAADRWWKTLVQSAPLQSIAPSGDSGEVDDRLSSALSKELLGTGTASDSDRAMLVALSQNPDEGQQRIAALPEMAQVQQRLGDAWLLIVVPSEPRSAALWISADQSRVATLPGQGVLREQIRRLTADLNLPSTPVSQINASALALSSSLFANAPSAAAPQRLLALSDELIGTIPLTLLVWPGSRQPLIETTVSGWVAKFAVESQSETTTTEFPLRAIIAPGNATTERAGLARLRYAEHEAELIAQADPEREVSSFSGGAATRAALLDALTEPSAWVHLAAHGYAKPQMLGYAGTWLASPADSTKSEFLSWMDIIDTPLHAQLAVLNACQLAAGPGATSQSSLSFASAVTAAGVDHVVAAFWPISDSASAVWIPAFYKAMRDQPASYSIEALRSAQLALKNSRAYRHPYYWASLAHFQRFSVAAAASGN